MEKAIGEKRKAEIEKLDFDVFRFPLSVLNSLISVLRFPLAVALSFSFSVFILSVNSSAQKIAVVAPEKDLPSRDFIEKLEAAFPENVKILDDDLSDAAFAAQRFEKPFNLTLTEAKRAGAAIGCEYFLLVKAENVRRVSAALEEFYESYAAVFLVSARTGRLVSWKIESRESNVFIEAQKRLFDSAKFTAAEISDCLKTVKAEELNEKALADFERLPEDDSIEAKNFRPPLPYKRLSPIYTPLANSYAVEATVDAEIDVDENGKILNVQIVRWAGFGLDESVAENVRRMNWRAASRDGKAVKTRVLLRYNFKKLEIAK